MNFHLDHTPSPPGFQIDHRCRILLAGSCFAENIGNRLRSLKFNVLVNPGGILFNPTSICNCLNGILSSEELKTDRLVERDGLFFSYDHHSSFSDSESAALLQKINSANAKAHDFLEKTDVLILTFGTAFVYHHKKLNTTVANCHKQPAAVFEKKLLEVDEIIVSYSDLIAGMKRINPSLKIIFTVSPVKYLKDGLENNSVSKSTLLLAVRKLVTAHAHCYYFPAYELVNDDLRDYRFYKEDLAHPNAMAIDYVWEKFSESFFDQATRVLNAEIRKLNLALNHRQMQENSTEIHKLNAFIKKQKQTVAKLNPEIEFE
jgi:hypothetical protein